MPAAVEMFAERRAKSTMAALTASCMLSPYSGRRSASSELRRYARRRSNAAVPLCTRARSSYACRVARISAELSEAKSSRGIRRSRCLTRACRLADDATNSSNASVAAREHAVVAASSAGSAEAAASAAARERAARRLTRLSIARTCEAGSAASALAALDSLVFSSSAADEKPAASSFACGSVSTCTSIRSDGCNVAAAGTCESDAHMASRRAEKRASICSGLTPSSFS
mmetsp:Transcript_6996/g.17913  ORF Transcript_6996/g.17913 Transcript_6996/m.17913 type:complete len:229 (+) Transcript_6996:829-1515(+)